MPTLFCGVYAIAWTAITQQI